MNDPWDAIDRISQVTDTSYSRESIDTNRVKPSYTSKQLKAMRKFNSQVQFEDPPEDQPKIVRKSRKKFHAFLLHSVAYLSYLWPRNWMKHEGELIPEGRLDQIRHYFENDWQQCARYVEQQRNGSSGEK